MTDEQPNENNQPVTPDESKPGKNGNREAARYRTQLREATAENEALKGRLREAQAEIVRGRLATSLANPDDFDQFVGLDAVLAEDGALDLERVDQSVAELLEQRPYLRPQPAGFSRHPRERFSSASGANLSEADEGEGWASVIRG